MSLNGQFISFQPVVEAVYRRAGYQYIDWAEAIEVIGETIRLIGALPAYQNITTNGLNGNPNPLEVTDYRVALPTTFMSLEAIRKIELTEIDDGEGGTDLKISSFVPIYESTDLFYKSIRNQWNESIPAGTYTYEEFKQTNTVTLSGISGTATITGAGDLTKVLTFDTDLETTASNFVTANATAYLVEDIVLTSSGDDLVFTSNVSGQPFTTPIITNTSGDLDGTVTSGTATDPVIVYGPTYLRSPEYQYNYKIDNGYIYTNFETGFLELSYKGFVTDDHGFPMIPDDPKFLEAVRWSIIEHIDYKKWRVSEITDKVYQHSEQQRDWYIAAARSKADIPSASKMEILKNMFLRSIPSTVDYTTYFKYSNIMENRYTHNSKNRMY